MAKRPMSDHFYRVAKADRDRAKAARKAKKLAERTPKEKQHEPAHPTVNG